MGSDYLAYALIDAVVDHFFPIVESLGEAIEDMQQSLLELPTREKLEGVHEFRKALSQLRRAVWPARDVSARLWRDETGLVSDRTKPFLRDSYDNTMSIIDLLESYRRVQPGTNINGTLSPSLLSVGKIRDSVCPDQHSIGTSSYGPVVDAASRIDF